MQWAGHFATLCRRAILCECRKAGLRRQSGYYSFESNGLT
jgi:hypothetical protein